MENHLSRVLVATLASTPSLTHLLVCNNQSRVQGTPLTPGLLSPLNPIGGSSTESLNDRVY